uniref:Uncharacterized protein n=1 Tax=Mola mola TaxID=94237 RepID=A0A3Q3WDQ7_MOLML
LFFTRAVVTRALFVLVSLVGVWRVTWVKKDLTYWFLTFLFLPLVAEMMITLKSRKGKDYRWFSPPIFLFLLSIIPSIWILEDHHQQNKETEPLNTTFGNHTMLTSVCPNDWILALHQIVLILLIVGKWLLPLGGGVTREELSQLLLIFVGTAADILEFVSETMSDIKESSPQLVYIILAVWTWSMLQFPLHLAVVNSDQNDEDEDRLRVVFLLAKYSTDLFTIVEALFIHDGPFLLLRLTIITYYKVFHQMLVFFAMKNFLVVILNMYRLVVICQDRPQSNRSENAVSVP